MGCGLNRTFTHLLTVNLDTTPGACNAVRFSMIKNWTPPAGPLASLGGIVRDTSAGEMPYFHMNKTGTSINLEVNDNTDATAFTDLHHFADQVYSVTFPTGGYTIQNSGAVVAPCN